ncbi:MAG: sulfotransferase [Candidatus Hodarchaeota archaeon]
MKLLFISGPGRSGTTLLKDLLDGHPQIAVWPNEWQFITLYKKYVRKNLFEKVSVGEILTCFQCDKKKFYPVLEGTVIDHRMKNVVSKFPKLNPDFTQKLWKDKDLNLNAKEFYYLVADSFRWQHSQNIFCNKCNDPQNIMEYMSHFREAGFIFMIRNPIASYISKLKHRAKGLNLVPPHFAWNVFLHSFLEIKDFFKSLKFLQESEDLFKNFIVIKMEDIRNNSFKSLKFITDSLNIEYNDSLTNLTFLGDPVPGYLADPKANSSRILPLENTEENQVGLTAKEKKWLLYHKDLFTSYYPEIENEIHNLPTVDLLRRTYMFFNKYQNTGKEQFIKLYSELLIPQS